MSVRARSFQNFLRDRRGSLTVEFVALTPMLLTALVFSFEFGKALWAYDVITRDVRAGVRYLSRVPVYDATSRGEAENVVTRGITGTTTPKHFPWGSETFAYSSANFTTAEYNTNGQVVTMTANVPVSLPFLAFLNSMVALSGGSPSNIPRNYTLSVSYQARLLGN